MDGWQYYFLSITSGVGCHAVMDVLFLLLLDWVIPVKEHGWRMVDGGG